MAITKEKIKKVKREKTKKEKRPKKEKVRKTPKVKIEKKLTLKKERFFEAIGRRKTAVARVRLFTRGEKAIMVNEKPYDIYFPTIDLQQIIRAPLDKMKCFGRFGIIIKVKGGGFHSQAEAVRHGIARALVLFNQDFKKRLKKAGYLTRDSRMRERKKFGLKRARRAPQWQKR